MKRTTITLLDDLEQVLDAYRRERSLPPALATVVQTLTREYLTSHGSVVVLPAQPLRGTPIERESGPTDVSIDHDRYFAEDVLEHKTGSSR